MNEGIMNQPTQYHFTVPPMCPLIPNSYLPIIDEITALNGFKETMKEIFKTKGHDNNSVMVECELCSALPCLFTGFSTRVEKPVVSSVLCISFLSNFVLCCAKNRQSKIWGLAEGLFQ